MIWISDAMVSTSCIKGFDQDNYLKDNDLAVDAMKRNNVGEPLPENRFPKDMYAEYKDKKEKNPTCSMRAELGRFLQHAPLFYANSTLVTEISIQSNCFNTIASHRLRASISA